MNTSIHRLAAAALGCAWLTACGANGIDPPSPPHVVDPSKNVLQLAVGSANVYGTAGLNVVVTYRQPSSGTEPGGSGTTVNSPTFTLPNALPAHAGAAPSSGDTLSTILTGPAPGEAGRNAMTATSQNIGASTLTTFGVSGDAVGLGIEPYNYTEGGVPFQVAPYPVPLYDATAADANQLPAAWGGPPAFDILGTGQSPVGSGNVPAGTAGVSLGLDVFAGIAPAGGGSYALAVNVPANTGTVNTSARFALPPALTMLGAFSPPLPTLDANNDGGATVAVTLPAGVSEAYVEIVDFGPAQPASGPGPVACNGASAASPIYYTIEVTASGTASLSGAIGPGGAPSLCTSSLNTAANSATAAGDQFTVQGIGFDYPIYEASYPKSLGNPAPKILGPAGSDDVTISTAPLYAEAAGSTTLQRSVRPLGLVRRVAPGPRAR